MYFLLTLLHGFSQRKTFRWVFNAFPAAVLAAATAVSSWATAACLLVRYVYMDQLDLL